MRNRVLGILLAVLAVLGGLNLVQAVRTHFVSDQDTATTVRTSVKHRSEYRAEGSVYLDQTFPVSRGQSLVVNVQHADIEVETGDFNEAHLTVTVNASTEDRAREIFEHMNFEAFQDGDQVVLKSEPLDEWNWNGRFSIDVHAQIPQEFDLDLESTHGDVELESIDGVVRLNTTHGDVDAERLAGPSISLESTHGEVHANALLTDDLIVRTTHGDISLGAVRTTHFDVVTTHSDIAISELDGGGELQTSHGDVSAGVFKLAGIQIQTTHGDVDLVLPASLGAAVDISAERVELSSSFSFDGMRDKEQATGRLNGGGPKLVVSTTYGEVSLRTN